MSFAADSSPKRAIIIGAGPSGFYAADQLLGAGFEVDLLDALPTPFGLVRAGVAPDHPKIKAVTRVYEKTAGKAGFRFFGAVKLGEHVSRAELLERYHVVLYAFGTSEDNRLGIPGEDRHGAHAATHFVAWYNGHPDAADHEFDLSSERAVVVGNGNVDLMRAGVEVDPRDLELDKHSQAWLEHEADVTSRKNVEILEGYAQQGPKDVSHRVTLRFLRSPVEILGEGDDGPVTGVRVVKNRIEPTDGGGLRAVATDETENIECGLVMRSIGYRGTPVDDIPFDERRGLIRNEGGRVTNEDGHAQTGEYVVGWIKRGPSGVIGTNKKDAADTTAKNPCRPRGRRARHTQRRRRPVRAVCRARAGGRDVGGLAGHRPGREGRRRAPRPPQGQVGAVGRLCGGRARAVADVTPGEHAG
jgi:ferredoxin--NADP+ reductase